MRTCASCKRTLQTAAPFCPHCGAPAPEAEPDAADDVPGAGGPDELLGRVLARKFRILSLLGEGGMGRIYKAEQMPIGVDVVIKTLHPQLANDRRVVKRFFREAQAASRLRHPNSVAIIDFGDAGDGTLYIAMELLRGRALADLLVDDGPFSPARVLRVMGQVLDVLEAAHRLGIIHRDLKPDNIMVEDLATQRDFVKVLDFGIAKIADARGTKLTQTGMIFGTPAYMAPEQAMAREIDGRADLYAVGVMCWELLVGRLPFVSESAALLVAQHATEPSPPLARERPDVPAALAALVDRALRKNPDDRPKSALEFRELLEAALQPVADAATTGPRAGGASPGPEPVPQPCPRCGTPNPPAAKFCAECGAATAPVSSSPLRDKFADLRRFLPSGVIDDLTALRTGGGGETREVVVLVVDVSTPASGADHEAVARALGELFGTLAEVTLRHGGSAQRDGVGRGIAIFGSSAEQGDDAERACLAAIELLGLLVRQNAGRPLQVEASMAIHGGAAVVGAGPGGRELEPVGDAVELPTRLAAAIEAGTVVVSEPIAQQVGASARLRERARLRLRGRAEPVPVWELVSMRPAGAAASPLLAVPPLVGRDPQLAAVLRVADSIGDGAAVHVTGEPGAGKSRFLAELVARLPARGMVAIAASARPGADGSSPAPAQILAALGGGAEALRALGVSTADVRQLGAWLGGPAPAVRGGEGDPRVGAVAALRATLEGAARGRPLALVIDDLHLADRMVVDLVKGLVEQPVSRLLLVVATRTGYPPPWTGERTAAGLPTAAMSPLDDAAMAALVRGALAPTPPPPELTRAVAARAGGSPLMAIEVLRAFVDAGHLGLLGGRWTVTGDLESAPRPAGLRALFAARIDSLSAYARDVLATASVIGDEVRAELLERILADAHAAPIDREIAIVVGRGLLAEAADEPGRLRFAEPLAREIVYERLLPDSRRRLHRLVADALAQAPGGGPIAPEVIGNHYFAAEAWPEALDWFGKAAAAAQAARDFPRAVAVLRKSRDAARRDLGGADAAGRNRRLADDSLALGEALLELGELADVVEVLTEGLVCGHKDDDPALIVRLQRARGRAHLVRSDVDTAQRDLDTALRGALALHDRRLLGELNGDLGDLAEKRGDPTRAAELYMRALELLQTGGPEEVRPAVLRLLTSLGRVCLRAREVDRAQRFLQQALTLAEELGDALGGAKALGNLAALHHAQKDYLTARRFVERSLELCRDAGDAIGVARQLHNLGTLHVALGDEVGAQRHFDAAYAAARRANWREGMAMATASRTRA